MLVLTVAEIVALVVVLAGFLILIILRLRSAAKTLGDVAGGVRAVEADVSQIGPGVGQLNRTLDAIAGALPSIAERAEAVAAQR